MITYNATYVKKLSKDVSEVEKVFYEIPAAFTKDGKWANLPKFGNPIVTHWMPLPEPSAED